MDEPACFHGLRKALRRDLVLSSYRRNFGIARIDNLPLVPWHHPISLGFGDNFRMACEDASIRYGLGRPPELNRMRNPQDLDIPLDNLDGAIKRGLKIAATESGGNVLIECLSIDEHVIASAIEDTFAGAYWKLDRSLVDYCPRSSIA
jgi:hypothetical protein